MNSRLEHYIANQLKHILQLCTEADLSVKHGDLNHAAYQFVRIQDAARALNSFLETLK